MAYRERGMAPAPRKKSLLIGINYVGSQHSLQGCHQDVENVREFRTSNKTHSRSPKVHKLTHSQ